MKHVLRAVTLLSLLIAALGVSLLGATSATATDTNDPDFWETLPGEICDKVDDSGAAEGGFTITTDPLEDYVFSKIIIKKGSGDSQGEENTVINNPVKGETYFHASGSGFSHVILCQVPEPDEPEVCPAGTDNVGEEIPEGQTAEEFCNNPPPPPPPGDVCPEGTDNVGEEIPEGETVASFCNEDDNPPPPPPGNPGPPQTPPVADTPTLPNTGMTDNLWALTALGLAVLGMGAGLIRRGRRQYI